MALGNLRQMGLDADGLGDWNIEYRNARTGLMTAAGQNSYARPWPWVTVSFDGNFT
jgi:hypothetical protein